MTRVVIVARTRMRHDHVCIGGHVLDGLFRAKFRGVRLLDRFGDHWRADSPFAVGDIWEIKYEEKTSARPPHVEDVFVLDCRRLGREENLKALVLKHARPWRGAPDALFDRTVRPTPTGGAHVPRTGKIPRHSTGYWIPDHDLVRGPYEKARFTWQGEGPIERITWVGVQAPPEQIEAGSLVRVSLSRLWKSETAPEGYYVQISGVIE